MRESDDLMDAIEFVECDGVLLPHTFDYIRAGGNGKSLFWTEEKIEEFKNCIKKAKLEGKLK